MTPSPVIAIFDIGKTNKKILLFDTAYRVVHEESITIPSIVDEDGFTCDDLQAMVGWIKQTIDGLLASGSWSIAAINFSTFGASLVHIDRNGKPVTPLYSYLKPIDRDTIDAFYRQFGSASSFPLQTGSPVLAMLNSGIQLYWLKYDRPESFRKIHCSLHLPQYLSYLFTGTCAADITSVGCHTGLWDVNRHDYHNWLDGEEVKRLLPAVSSFRQVYQVDYNGHKIKAGIGLHDSSASVLPFTMLSSAPVCILSTGTWNISMIPSFTGKLEDEDYRRDCLYYFLDKKQPVAAARIFLGQEIECQLKKLNEYFQKEAAYYLDVRTDAEIVPGLVAANCPATTFIPEVMEGTGPYPSLKGKGADPGLFVSFEEAYHKLMLDAAWLQKESLDLLLRQSPVKDIYVTGGFARNVVFMDMLQHFFPTMKFHLASVSNGSALGAALAIHDSWNTADLERNVVETLPYRASATLDLSGYSYKGWG